MNQQEWLSCTNPEPMLALVRRGLSERNLRLFACLCCRRAWHLLVDERSRKAVETAEAFARGEIGQSELEVAKESARAAYLERSQSSDDHAAAAAYYCTTVGASFLPAAANRILAAVEQKEVEREAQASILREIIGNPFQDDFLVG